MIAAHTYSRIRIRGRIARRGVVVLESACMLLILLTVIFVILELGIVLFRKEQLTIAAQRISRTAMVRGADAPAGSAVWGPTVYHGTAADSGEIATAARATLTTMAAADVTITVTWPNGDAQEGSDAVVEVEYLHRPLISFLAFYATMPLRGQSRVRIAH